MRDQIAVNTALFNTTDVKDHFINECCFGEDFAAWIRQQLTQLEPAGFALSVPIQEDYGWGIRVTHGKDNYWIAASPVQDGPQQGPIDWMVSVSHDPGLNVVARIFRKPSPHAFDRVRDQVWSAIKANGSMRVVAADDVDNEGEDE